MLSLRNLVALSALVVAGSTVAMGTAVAQGQACESITLLSPADHREVHFVDMDGNGLSVGDRRVGHRRLFDENDNFVADRMWTVTVHEVNDAGEATLTSAENVTVFEDGVIFGRIDVPEPENFDNPDVLSNPPEINLHTIFGGTGAYANAQGTIEMVDRTANTITYVYAATCQ
ncbi:MAG: hypothetical protein AAGG65_16490 [Pseudomonadota bacterium]